MKPTITSTYFQWRVAVEHWGTPILAIGLLILTQLALGLAQLQSRHVVAVAVIAFALQVVGAIMILKAKFPAYRTGRYWAFGVASVQPELIRCYIIGRRLLVVGVLMATSLLAMLYV